MSHSTIEQALAAASETKGFISGNGCRADVPQIFQQYFPGATALIVADDNTFRVAGQDVYERLQAANIPTEPPFIFPGTPVLHSEYRHIEALREKLKPLKNVIPISVGSGTINDLVKRTVYELDRRYMVVATAASVDGYSSFGAPVVQGGFKKTMECPAPLVIVADIEILRNAPAEMTAAGYADLMSKITAGADWIIADALGITPIRPDIWEMIQPPLRHWVAAPEKLAAGDDEAFSMLFEGLSMTGFAMQAMRDSRPASGSEHLFSHIWDMNDHRDASGNNVSHGFQVGIGMLGVTALMETVFRRDIRALDIDARCQQWPSWEARDAEIRQAFAGMPIVDRVLMESRVKYLEPDELRARLHLVAGIWDELRQRVTAQIFPYPILRQKLQVASCPFAPDQIRLTREQMKETYLMAQMIRNRYTILDLAYELGWLEACADEIVSSSRYFS